MEEPKVINHDLIRLREKITAANADVVSKKTTQTTTTTGNALITGNLTVTGTITTSTGFAGSTTNTTTEIVSNILLDGGSF